MASFEAIKEAVFYAHEKPELLAKIISEASSGGGGDVSGLTQKVNALETKLTDYETVKTNAEKVPTIETKIEDYDTVKSNAEKYTSLEERVKALESKGDV